MSTVTINERMQTLPLTSDNTPASIHTQTINYQQIGDRTHTFETSRHQQHKFTTCSKKPHHDTRSTNNANTISRRRPTEHSQI
nr:hypothetical protein [Tanacetum cinerariifolium]